MSNNKYGIKKAASKSDGLNIKINEPVRDLGALEGATLKGTLNLDTLQPELSAKLDTLNTSTVSATTVDRFLSPIQGYVQTVINSARGRTDGVTGWWEKWSAARAQRRGEEIARLLVEAQAEMQAGNWKPAIKKLDRVLKLDRDSYIAMYLKATCLAALPELDAAVKLATEGESRCPDPELRESFRQLLEKLHEMMVFMPVLIGIAAMMEKNCRVAIACFEVSLALRPQQPEVLTYKAMCHVYEGELSQARQSVEAAQSMSPSKEMAAMLRQVLEVVAVRERMEQAVQRMAKDDFRGALQILGDRSLRDAGSQVLFLRAVCQFRLDQTDAAEETLRQIMRDDDSAETRQLVAQLREQMAFGGVQTLIARATAEMEAYNWHGALRALREAETKLARVAPNQPLVQFYIAICELRLGDSYSARAALRKGRLGSPEGELEKAYSMFERSL